MLDQTHDTEVTMRLILILLTVLSFPAAAQVYKWTDANGVTHFGTQPPPGQQESVDIRESSPGAMLTDGQRSLLDQRESERNAHRASVQEAAKSDSYGCDSARDDLKYWQDVKRDFGRSGYRQSEMNAIDSNISQSRREIRDKCNSVR